MAQADGVKLALSTDGKVKATGSDDALTRWLPILQRSKPEIVEALRGGDREPWRVKVEAMLEGGRKYAIVAGNPADDPVVVSIAILDLGSFQIEVPKQFYDPFVLLKLVQEHSGEGLPC